MSQDPYRYFRGEARELVEGLTQGVLDLEKGRRDPELVTRILRYAHTLKGAARIVKQARIAELSHSLEGALAGLRDKPETISKDIVRQLLAWIDGISSDLASLASASEAAATGGSLPSSARPSAPETTDEQLETLRVEMTDMDALLRTAAELRVQMGGLSRLAQELQKTARRTASLGLEAAPRRVGSVRRARSHSPGARERFDRTLTDLHRSISAAVERSDRELEGLCQQAEAIRLVPATSLFSVLERTARDAAEATGKQITFQASGGDTRLDARALRLLRNALVQLVRNAVTHGLESPAERAQLGKASAGRVQIGVERRGDLAVFLCLDDGRGVDVERVRQVALERKLASIAEVTKLTPARALALLLGGGIAGGITTAARVSQLSGRGVGLEVVRQAVAALKGSLAGRTEPGKGTRIEVAVPVVVESQEVLHVQAAEILASIPLRAIRQAMRLAPAEIAVSSEGQSILYEGKAVRYAPLLRLLKHSANQALRRVTALVLESPGGLAALGVDHVAGGERVVIRALPHILGTVPGVSGAFLNSEGVPQLVLNPDEMIEAIHSASPLQESSPVPRTGRLLVIDDSLTSRMLEQGILEGAGYQVDTASSGEEAMEKASQTPYDLFVVDLEMPGMDGFQFIQATRAQQQLSAVPSIIVSSRTSTEDRAKGAAVGARVYIVKGDFDEGLFLKTVRELMS